MLVINSNLLILAKYFIDAIFKREALIVFAKFAKNYKNK